VDGWLLVVGCWLLVVGCWSLVVGGWFLLAAENSGSIRRTHVNGFHKQSNSVFFCTSCGGAEAPTNYQQPTTNNQPPTTNHQQPTTNHQLPTTNYQLPTNYLPTFFVTSALTRCVGVVLLSQGVRDQIHL
jgi:hypothetical protein